MTKEIIQQLIQIAEQRGVKYSKHTEQPHPHLPTYFWTKRNVKEPFDSMSFNLDADRFYDLCIEKNLLTPLDKKLRYEN